jgi:hypothetical protein
VKNVILACNFYLNQASAKIFCQLQLPDA